MKPPLIPLLFSLLLSTACGPTMVRPVSENNSAKDGSYDGNYQAAIQPASTQQRRGDWRIPCSELDEKFGLMVREGKATLLFDGNRIPTYIGQNGKFRVNLPTGQRMSSSLASDVHMSSRVNLIIHGDINEDAMDGQFIVGIEQLGNDGCRYPVQFEKLSK